MKLSIRNISKISLFAAMLAIFSQIVIPTSVPFTLQSLGVMLACMMLGGKGALTSVFIYICLGAAGLPVFSSFSGGIGILMGPLGGYIFGFIGMCLTFWLIEATVKYSFAKPLGCIAGLLICYTFGTIQYYFVSGAALSLCELLTLCVLPFVIPDTLKLAVAIVAHKRLNKYNFSRVVNYT